MYTYSWLNFLWENIFYTFQREGEVVSIYGILTSIELVERGGETSCFVLLFITLFFLIIAWSFTLSLIIFSQIFSSTFSPNPSTSNTSFRLLKGPFLFFHVSRFFILLCDTLKLDARIVKIDLDFGILPVMRRNAILKEKLPCQPVKIGAI